MDTRTGQIHESMEGESMADFAKRVGVPEQNLKPVTRPLTVREKLKEKINKYAPCGCGSGKKFKFCCYRP